MKRIIYFLLAFCAASILHSCSEDETEVVPVITVSDIGRNSAVINITVPEEEKENILEYGIYWSETNENPTATDKIALAEPDESGNSRIELTELKGGTTYYVKGFALNNSTTITSGTASFTTLTGIPELSIRVLITDEFDVTIKDLGGGKIKEVGYCYVVDNGNISDDFMPSIENSEREVSSKSLNQDVTRFRIQYTGGFSGISHIQYYGRVYIITDNGIGYSQRVHYASHIR